ncbi:MAG TPA: NAD(P)H-dependent oxidoreductase [Rhizomicrobium sp.]|jgi:putative NADPH-quinone reductase|nr:NAD(P)H-dependent oxidoreductase [Rhizomicrobium sp.]
MSRNILVVNGHPDPRPERFCAALCDAYAAGAAARGCATRRLDVGALNLASLADDDSEWESVEQAFRLVRAADRLAIFYPLWANAPPAELRQMFDYISRLSAHLQPHAAVKAARVVVTTGLPAFLYRGKLKDDALRGIAAGAPTLIGSVESITSAQRARWLEQVHDYGATLS